MYVQVIQFRSQIYFNLKRKITINNIDNVLNYSKICIENIFHDSYSRFSEIIMFGNFLHFILLS